MTNVELSDQFDVLVNSYKRFKDFDKLEILDSIEFNEYEKSLFLTMAQDEVVTSYYSGKNIEGIAFETTEEARRLLDFLVKTVTYNKENAQKGLGITPFSVCFELPEDLLYITLELVTFDDESLGCFNGTTSNVYPITLDEYSRVKNNPFRGPTKYKVLRLDYGSNIAELISKYQISQYLIKYVKKPLPIILEDLPNNLTIKGINTNTECELNEHLHNIILKRAVQLALLSKYIGVNTDNK